MHESDVMVSICIMNEKCAALTLCSSSRVEPAGAQWFKPGLQKCKCVFNYYSWQSILIDSDSDSDSDKKSLFVIKMLNC